MRRRGVRRQGTTLVLAATDLSNYLGCPHRSGLDLAVAEGARAVPDRRANATLLALQERGHAHELAYLEHLRQQGLQLTSVPDEVSPDVRVQQTQDALHAGADVVYQGAFRHDRWFGYADILRKIPNPPGTTSLLGDWHYEPHDTKLAQDTRAGTILQLALYAELLAEAQGVHPAYFHVITPGTPFITHQYRFDDYGAYFRRIRDRLLDHLARGHDAIVNEDYPEPVEHCAVCRWWDQCDERRRADDHLSFIAGASRGQRTELADKGVTTLAQAAELPVPLTFRPSRGSREALERLVQQAAVQLEQRVQRQPVYHLFPIEAAKGLCRLPEPSPGDVFLDFEGARFARPGGHEYLTGVGQADHEGTLAYEATWSWTPNDERQALEAFIDRCVATRARDAQFHIFHFGAYEPTTLKRLAGRYATRQDMLDLILREERFIDLHTIVRQALRAGVESYSLKQLEQYYAFMRALPLQEANRHLHAVEAAVEAGIPAAAQPESQIAVERYNEDDVRSTAALRSCLEDLRRQRIEAGDEIPRPVQEVTEIEVTERTAAAEALRTLLLAGLDADAYLPHHEHHPRWLLTYLIDWHHREERAGWWEYFRLRDADADELFDEPKAIAALTHVEVVGDFLGKNGKPTGSLIHRYRFPQQDVEISEGKQLLTHPDAKLFGTLLTLDRAALNIDVKRGKTADSHPAAVFLKEVVPNQTLQESVMRFAEQLRAADYSVASAGSDLLWRRPPRLRTSTLARLAGETAAELAERLITDLDRTVLAVQGPPGAGKTHVGARMIQAALAAGQRVGVTATSHKVIQNLLSQLHAQATDSGETVAIGRRADKEDVPDEVRRFRDNEKAIEALANGEVHVLGGTAWLWSDPVATASLDTLFIDEAGQMSLASVLAVAPAATNLVLLGDPQQLNQPQRASHPDGVDVSALAHLIGSAPVIASDRGIFMTDTWRMAPAICSFTSELFYRGQLSSKPDLVAQRLVSTDGFDGASLWWIPVSHVGSRNVAEAEVDTVEQLVSRLMQAGAGWIDAAEVEQPLTASEIRVVAPYNAQVNRLSARLAPTGVEVGTVDKFQGQTCAAVIYSMASSSAEDAPRGMEFLYSPNRLNVATSRARCAVFIVASPTLLAPECRTPRQMHLANGLCRFVELATTVNPDS